MITWSQILSVADSNQTGIVDLGLWVKMKEINYQAIFHISL